MAAAAAAAAAAQAAADLQELEACLTVCGITTAAQQAGITVREGYVSLRAFARVRPNEVSDIAKTRPYAVCSRCT